MTILAASAGITVPLGAIRRSSSNRLAVYVYVSDGGSCTLPKLVWNATSGILLECCHKNTNQYRHCISRLEQLLVNVCVVRHKQYVTVCVMIHATDHDMIVQSRPPPSFRKGF